MYDYQKLLDSDIEIALEIQTCTGWECNEISICEGK